MTPPPTTRLMANDFTPNVRNRMPLDVHGGGAGRGAGERVLFYRQISTGFPTISSELVNSWSTRGGRRPVNQYRTSRRPTTSFVGADVHVGRTLVMTRRYLPIDSPRRRPSRARARAQTGQRRAIQREDNEHSNERTFEHSNIRTFEHSNGTTRPSRSTSTRGDDVGLSRRSTAARLRDGA